MVLAIVAAMFFITGIAGAATSPGVIGSSSCDPASSSFDINACIGVALPLAVAALMVSFMVVALAYIMGQVLGISALKNWYRGELWEIVKTIAVIAIIYSVIVIAGAAAASLTNAPASSNPTTSISNLYSADTNFLQSQAVFSQEAFDVAFGEAESLAYQKSITGESLFTYPLVVQPGYLIQASGICIPGPIDDVPTDTYCLLATSLWGASGNLFVSSMIESVGGGPNAFLSIATSMIILPMQIILTSLYILFDQLVFIGLGVFLPLGIIFRAIPFLRGIGGTLIAISIALALIFPGVIAGFNIPVSNVFSFAYSNAASTNACGVQNSGGNILYWAICSGLSSILALVTNPGSFFATAPDGAIFTTAYQYGYNAGMATWFGSTIYPDINAVMVYTLPLILQFITLIIDIILIVAMTSSIANMMGGTLKLGIGKMKLA